MDLRVGTVVLFITMLKPGGHGIMETAVTICITGYVRQSQARYETSQVEMALTAQCMWLFFKIYSYDRYTLYDT